MIGGSSKPRENTPTAIIYLSPDLLVSPKTAPRTSNTQATTHPCKSHSKEWTLRVIITSTRTATRTLRRTASVLVSAYYLGNY